MEADWLVLVIGGGKAGDWAWFWGNGGWFGRENGAWLEGKWGLRPRPKSNGWGARRGCGWGQVVIREMFPYKRPKARSRQTWSGVLQGVILCDKNCRSRWLKVIQNIGMASAER